LLHEQLDRLHKLLRVVIVKEVQIDAMLAHKHKRRVIALPDEMNTVCQYGSRQERKER
jgi:hypothetical protein